MITKYMVIFGIVFLIMHKIHSVNRRDFENFFGEDVARIASHFRWDTEKADRVFKEKFGSTMLPTASVTSGFSNDELIHNSRPKVFERLSVNNKKANIGLLKKNIAALILVLFAESARRNSSLLRSPLYFDAILASTPFS